MTYKSVAEPCEHMWPNVPTGNVIIISVKQVSLILGIQSQSKILIEIVLRITVALYNIESVY